MSKAAFSKFSFLGIDGFPEVFFGQNLRLGPPEWVSERGILFKINFIEARQNFVFVF
jgi:hypothetical protein